MDLENKRAVVTGGSSGLGLGLVEALEVSGDAERRLVHLAQAAREPLHHGGMTARIGRQISNGAGKE